MAPAAALLAEGLALARQVGDARVIALALDTQAEVALGRGAVDATAALLEESVALRRALGDDAFVAAWAEGAAWPPERAVAAALASVSPSSSYPSFTGIAPHEVRHEARRAHGAGYTEAMKLHTRRTRPFDPAAPHPALALATSLALLALLVPLLRHWHGADGPLGPSIPLFFLAPVLLSSIVGGRRAGVVVSVVAILVWDWYFIQPLYTVTVGTARDLLALMVFLAVALLTGQLSRIARRRAEEALRRAHSSEALYDLSMALITGGDLERILPDLIERLRATFELQACAVLLPGGASGGWRTAAVAGTLPADLHVEESRDVASVAMWVNTQGRESGLGRSGRDREPRHGRAPRLRAHEERAHFLPLRVEARPVGVLELVYAAGTPPDLEREHLLATFANGAAIALEQARLAEEERAAAVARESDRLKSALLSSVSHDLRTPLAGIKAAASSLLQTDVAWSEEDRALFARDIDSEADRLTRLVSNLLDLSRIEAGAIVPDKEWEDLAELADRVIRRLEPRLDGHPVVRDIPTALPPVRLDAVQIEQVLTNLIENAAKYSLSGAPITVAASVDEHGPGLALRLAVSDEGPGIQPSERERIFDKFYRIAGSARRASGTGMGLAIVKGLVEAHGGRIVVEAAANRVGHGSAFTVTLPIEEDRAPGRAAAATSAGGDSREEAP